MNKAVKNLSKYLAVMLMLVAVGCENDSTLIGPESESTEYIAVKQGEHEMQVPRNLPSFKGGLDPLTLSAASSDACTIQSFGDSRTDGAWGFTEAYFSTARGYLLDTANYGAGGIYPDPVVIGAGVSTASATTLAGADVFFVGWVPTSSYTAAEKQAILDFVLAGGAVIATTDDTGHTMADIFGVTQGNGSFNPSTVTNTLHPIANGPFGPVASYTQYGTVGHYPDLGPYAEQFGQNASGQTTIATIAEGAIAPGSGRVVFVSDVDVLSNWSPGAVVNETLVKNIFAWTCEEPLIEVSIDIKPGSDPNSINTKSNGVVPVAILGSDSFDVTDVDVTTLTFGPAGASPAHDLTDPLVYADHLEDVNGDGYTDLVSHYRQKEMGLVLGDTEACISGATNSGTPISGCDSVNVVQ